MLSHTLRLLAPAMLLVTSGVAGCTKPPTDETDPLPTVFGNKQIDPRTLGPGSGTGTGGGMGGGMGMGRTKMLSPDEGMMEVHVPGSGGGKGTGGGNMDGSGGGRQSARKNSKDSKTEKDTPEGEHKPGTGGGKGAGGGNMDGTGGGQQKRKKNRDTPESKIDSEPKNDDAKSPPSSGSDNAESPNQQPDPKGTKKEQP